MRADNDCAVLELRVVGSLAGTFRVKRYQRGYRWGEEEVTRLLDDIWCSRGQPYCLQPVVVKAAGPDEWELVDGQQRLTTLLLILLYMKRAELKRIEPKYRIRYDTRPELARYFETFDPDLAKTNIDLYHLHQAYSCIAGWFESPDRENGDPQLAADDIYGCLSRTVRVIWYRVPEATRATTLFRRLNVGKISLTNAELVKALLLSRSRSEVSGSSRAEERAAQWDAIERDLQDEDLWAFVSDGHEAGREATRISLLLDTLAGGLRGRKRPRVHTFDVLRTRIEADAEAFWTSVVDLYARILGWFADRSVYHKVGYLVATGVAFADLVGLAEGKRRSEFEGALDAAIRDRLRLTASRVHDLRYGTSGHEEKLHRLLLLMNVESVRRMENTSERYPFRLHREGTGRDKPRWSLEHIHAQHAEQLNKEVERRSWLQEHKRSLQDLPDSAGAENRSLRRRIDVALGKVDGDTFDKLSGDVAAHFSRDSGAEMHAIGNLALLESGQNTALSNSVFEVKRRKILELDRAGEYIPICTRRVFLKYYAGADAQQVHFWSRRDREAYLDAMLGKERGVLRPYLMPEAEGA